MSARFDRLDRDASALRLPEFPAMLEAASAAQANARATYSGFAVGAAVLAEDGRVFAGCNVESASYGATICAERSAAAAAVSGGAKSIRAVVVVTPTPEPSTPCGICRQLLAEFGTGMVVFAASSVTDRVTGTTLGDLLPLSFGAADLGAADPGAAGR